MPFNLGTIRWLGGRAESVEKQNPNQRSRHKPAMISLIRTYFFSALLIAAALSSGCASAPTKTIQIDSDPQGVRVECNNEDLGKTPTSFTVRTNPEGEFLGAWAGSP